MRAVVSLLVAAVLAGCATRTAATTGTFSARTAEEEMQQQAEDRAAEQAAARKKPHRLPADIVARAALPMHGLVLATGVALPPDILAEQLTQADAICIGEEHDNPHVHWAELQLFLRTMERAHMSGREVGIGFEMVQTDDQATLDRFGARKIRRRELAKALDWDKTWGFDFALYEPLFSAARARSAAILALNAPQALVSDVARKGLDGLDPEVRDTLPQLDLGVEAHRKRFDQAMQGHPDIGDLDDMYTAQVVRDETMARTAARWLAKGAPARQLVIIAGAEHCRSYAVPDRIKRRAQVQVVSVRPYVAGDDEEKPDLDGYQYAAVLGAEN